MNRQEAVTFKGTRHGVTLVLNAQAEFEAALAELRKKLAKAGDFFAGAAVTVTIDRPLSPTEASALVEVLCVEHGLQLAGIVNPVTRPSAVASPPAFAPAPPPAAKRAPAGEKLSGGEQTLLVRRTIRSGQRITFDGNVVVMGDLNPGGEVVASGDIIVLGALRGTAHAGARGRTDATVTALRLMPTQLRIAHLITRAPDGKAAAPKGPETARIKGEAVVVEEFAF
ncbi:MAG: septum site-determining protein MinC [Bacillota bacterium]|nr:septum site-determining protein MinC [Bacillota bacterium]